MTLTVGPEVKTYWAANVAFLQRSVAVGRAYWLARGADLATHDGRGYLALADYREAMCDRWQVWTRRHLRNVLADVEEMGVGSIDHGETLRIHGMVATARALDIGKLRGRPVYLPTIALIESAQLTAAHFYASVESARPAPGPMSRQTLEELTGVPASTQRMYDALLGRESRQNIVVTDVAWNTANVQNFAYERGHNLFPFTDRRGLRGPAGKKYIAYQLPATRAPIHEQAPRGRQQKVNARLNLVTKGARGNQSDVTAVYHPNATAAAAAFNRKPQVDHYYIDDGLFVPDADEPTRLQYVTVWGVVS